MLRVCIENRCRSLCHSLVFTCPLEFFFYFVTLCHLTRICTCFVFSFLQLVRTCARYHVEVRKTEERKKMEEELRLRNIAGVIAREVDYFWSNIEQVKYPEHVRVTYRRYTVISHLCSRANFFTKFLWNVLYIFFVSGGGNQAPSGDLMQKTESTQATEIRKQRWERRVFVHLVSVSLKYI